MRLRLVDSTGACGLSRQTPTFSLCQDKDSTMMTASQNGSHSVEEELPVILTTDEEGQQHKFQMMDMIEVEGQAYGLLLYLRDGQSEEDTNEEGYEEEFVIMRIVEEDGEQVFESIEDDEEFEKVLAYVEAMDDEDDDEEEEPFDAN